MGASPRWRREEKVGPEKFAEMLDKLTGYGLMGLECWYSKYFPDRCEPLVGIAKEHGLLISGGSDYHGTNKTIPLGTLNAEGREVALEQITLLNALAEQSD